MKPNQSLQQTLDPVAILAAAKPTPASIAAEPRRYVAAVLLSVILSASGAASDQSCETRYSEAESEEWIKIVSNDTNHDGDLVAIEYPRLTSESRASVAIGFEHTYKGLAPFYTTVLAEIECHETCVTPVSYTDIPEYLSLKVLVSLTVYGECKENYSASKVVREVAP